LSIVCVLWTLELADRDDVVYVGMSVGIRVRRSTGLAGVPVPLPCAPADAPPPSVVVHVAFLPVVVGLTDDVLREPVPVTLAATEPDGVPLHPGSELRHLGPALLALRVDALGVLVGPEFVEALPVFDTVRAVDPGLVRRVLLERRPTPLAGRRLLGARPVAVVPPGVGVAVVAVLEPGLRAVELGPTPATGPVGQRFAVDLRVVLVPCSVDGASPQVGRVSVAEDPPPRDENRRQPS
jgi:hypothetical protein